MTKTAKQKAPAYQWYPSDFASDEKVMLMTLEEEGAYRRLLDHQWLHGSVPLDLAALAIICKGVTVAKMRRMWVRLAECFPPLTTDPTRGANPRLERTREARQEHSSAMATAGQKGAHSRWHKDGQAIAKPSPSHSQAIEKPMAPDSSSSSSSSSSSPTSPTAVAVVEVGRPPHGGGDGTPRSGIATRDPDGWAAWLAAVPDGYRPAIDGALRAHRQPDSLRRELLALTTPITGGPAYPPPVVAQAVHELAVAGSPLGSAALRAFCRRIVQGEPPPRTTRGGTEIDWDAELTKLAQQEAA